MGLNVILIFSLIVVHSLFTCLLLHYNVVVNFLSQVIFVFLFCLGMVMYANKVETEDKNYLR